MNSCLTVKSYLLNSFTIHFELLIISQFRDSLNELLITFSYFILFLDQNN
jgi:hypothetical protein